MRNLRATKLSRHRGSDWRPRLIHLATVLGFAIPAVAYLWMIHAYGVNVIYLDQWDDVALIGHAYSGTLHFSTLWAQHNENRIFFPNLIVLALAYTTHFNLVTEEYLSALMLFGGTALIICAHKRRSPERRWIWYCPVAFLLFSLAQADNTLWGFQMAWYLVVLTVALALYLLDREPLRMLVFGGAIAAAVVASFSSVQGLLVWPTGLLLICLRRRPAHLATAWIGSAVLAGVIYFVGFNSSVGSPSQALLHDPVGFLTLFLRIAGDLAGDPQPGALVTLFGSMLVVTAIWALVRFSTRERTTTGGRPLALSLIFFGLLVSGLTAYGRSGLGVIGFAALNRYTVFAVFVLVGLYLAVLDPPLAPELRSSAPPPPARRTGQRQPFSEPLFALARGVVGIGIVLTVIIGSANGITQARESRQNLLYLGQVIVRANQYPDVVVAQTLYFFASTPTVLHWITIAKDDRLSLFGTGDAARYLSEKPIHFRISPLRAAMMFPHTGSTLHGKQVLDVFASGSYEVTRVDYFLSGPGLAEASFATGVMTNYGWLATWNTSKVPNGSYTIDATVYDSRGRSVRILPVEVRVENATTPALPTVPPPRRVVQPPPTAQPPSTQPPATHVYVVQPGDTLWALAARYLGNPLRYQQLFALNRGISQVDGFTLVDPNLIYPGMKLVFPADAVGLPPPAP